MCVLTALRFIGFVLAILGHITTKVWRYAIGFVKNILAAANLTRLAFRRSCRCKKRRKFKNLNMKMQNLKIFIHE